MSHDDARADLGRLLLWLLVVQETTSEFIHDLQGVYGRGRLSLQLQPVSDGVVESEASLQSMQWEELRRDGRARAANPIRKCKGV
jgi:hypothetical protein